MPVKETPETDFTQKISDQLHQGFFFKSFNCDKLGCENDCEGRNDERELQGTHHFLLSFMRLGSGCRAAS